MAASDEGPLEQATKEEINCMRLFARCEMQIRDGVSESAGVVSGTGLRKMESYLTALQAKVAYLRRLRDEGRRLNYASKLDHIGTRVEDMQRRIETLRKEDLDDLDEDDDGAFASVGVANQSYNFKETPHPGVVLIKCNSIGILEKDSKQKANNAKVADETTLASTLKHSDDGYVLRQNKPRIHRLRKKRLSLQARLEEEKLNQEDLKREIMDLTHELKSLQMEVSTFFSKDRKTLDAIQNKMEDNLDATLSESKRLNEYNNTSSEMCKTFSTLGFVGLSFTATYIFIRVFPL